MGELDRFAQASPKWMNSAAETCIGVTMQGARKVTLFDLSGNELFTTASQTHVNVRQDVEISTGNSSTTNITASGSFIGSACSTLGVAGIQVMFHCDIHCEIYVEQSSNGTDWDISDLYKYYRHLDNFGITIQAVGAYFRVRIVNPSITKSTTELRLTSITCPIVEALPRSLDEDGHLQVSVEGLNDHFGFVGQFTPMRDLKTTTTCKLVGTQFVSAADTKFWTLSTSGTSAYATVSNGICTLSSGNSGSGYAKLASVRVARFIFGNPNLQRGLFKLSEVIVAKNSRKWGAFIATADVPTNGFYFSVSNDGLLAANTCNNGTETSIKSGDFNGQVSEFALDTNVHAYEIMYYMMGVWFYVDEVLLHKFVPTVAPLSQVFNLPITSISSNSASGTANASIEIWSSSIMRLGPMQTSPISYFVTGTGTVNLKMSAGQLHNLTLSGVTVNSVVKLIDGTDSSGTTLYSTGSMPALSTPMSINLDAMPFFTGLTIVVTAANTLVSITYE